MDESISIEIINKKNRFQKELHEPLNLKYSYCYKEFTVKYRIDIDEEN